MGTLLRNLASFLNRSKRTLLLVMIVVIASVTVSTTVAMLLSKRGNLTVSSLGTIKTIGVETYWDPNRENKAQLINWDEVLVGASKDVTVYIRNVSNQKVTLDLEATDWNPAKLAGYTTLSWDYNGASLDPGEIIQVTLTLSFSSSESLSRYLIEENVLNYSFDINIVAS